MALKPSTIPFSCYLSTWPYLLILVVLAINISHQTSKGQGENKNHQAEKTIQTIVALAKDLESRSVAVEDLAASNVAVEPGALPIREQVEQKGRSSDSTSP